MKKDWPKAAPRAAQKGRSEGRAEAIAEFAGRLKNLGWSTDEIIKATGLTKDEREKI